MRFSFSVFFFVCGISLLPSAAFMCGWCSKDDPLPVLDSIADDARFGIQRSALLLGVSVAGTIDIAPLCLRTDESDVAPPVHDRFYTEYLMSYFPKADVMLHRLFVTMCPGALQRALGSLVYLITYTPWRYFVNAADDVRLESAHVYIICEQLLRIVFAVKMLIFDPSTQLLVDSITLPEGVARRYSTVLEVWRRSRSLDEFHTLVALTIDTLIHRLYCAVKYEQYRDAYELQSSLQMMSKLLAGSRYEQHYVQTMRLFVDVVKMLQQRVWGDIADMPSSIRRKKNMITLSVDTTKPPAIRFLESFIGHYEANVTGKFTHEYHPMLLAETAASFATLEARLQAETLPIVGRLTLMGYEEQGITRYKTRHTDVILSDEMSTRTNAGWSLKMFNRFGLLTGFLCKDVAALKQRTGCAVPVTHIDADEIEIFDGVGTLFQEHAFGDAYAPTLAAYHQAQSALKRGDMKSFFTVCMEFWNLLYSDELKVTGRQHVVGTQDILFSMAYMQYLQKSPVPLLHFYVGPDITYPIEMSLLHNRDATRHAQSFVKKFTAQLQQPHEKKTAYVFCSFVDGVGKSTMLGNVQNMMKHGSCVEAYEHVDNSSSQLATVFDYSQSVVIADLPAQVSHFTYKPDGYVYVDCGAVCDAAELAAVQEYVAHNKQRLRAEFSEVLSQAAALPAYDLKECEACNPELSYAATLHLLKKSASGEWISFTYNNELYVYYIHDITRIRKRVPLATAPSHGLKNCCPEQMIFTHGVRFPMQYDYFLSDLMKQLKEHGAEQIVMVDFISMYSRSSRENIRVNYLIQQLALLDSEFVLEHSFYQNFVNNAQLLAVLDKPEQRAHFLETWKQESAVRLALFDLLFEHGSTHVEGIPLTRLTELLRARMKKYDATVTEKLSALVTRKMAHQYEHLLRGYGMSREYIALQQFHAPDLCRWSAALVTMMTETIACEELNRVWHPFVGATRVRIVDEVSRLAVSAEPVRGVLDTGAAVEVIGRIAPDCRDRQELTSIIRIARARWHAALSNVLYGCERQGRLHTEQRLPVLPLCVLPDQEGMLCFVQPMLPGVLITQDTKLPNYSLFDLNIPRTQRGASHKVWRTIGNQLYLHDWSQVTSSHGGVYAYGHELSNEPIENQGPRTAIVSNLYTLYAQLNGADKVLVPEKLYEMVLQEKAAVLEANRVRWEAEAEQNGHLPDECVLPVSEERGSYKKGRAPAQVFLIAEDQKKAVQLYLRSVATLDMLVKDLESDFALRRYNQKDFKAHILLTEQITLPWLFGLFSPEPLFDDYDQLQPVCRNQLA
jgi:hypothetical protein